MPLVPGTNPNSIQSPNGLIANVRAAYQPPSITPGGGASARLNSSDSSVAYPSFAQNSAILVSANIINLQATLTVPGLAATATSTLTGSIPINALSSFTVKSSDVAQTTISNIYVPSYTNAVFGPANIYVNNSVVGGVQPDAWGTFPQGTFRVQANISIPIYAAAAVSAGSITVTFSVLVHGAAKG